MTKGKKKAELSTVASMPKQSLISEINSDSKNGQLKKDIFTYMIVHGPSTVTNLAHHVMLSVPTVTKFVNELLSKGCLMNYGKLETAGGRHPYLYGLHPGAGLFIGVDVQHNGVNIGMMNMVGEILIEEYEVPFTLRNQDENLEELCALILSFVERHEIAIDHILNVNINLPGRINPNKGTSHTYFSNHTSPSLASVLRDKLGTYVSIDNDTRGMAYGEFTQGVAADLGANNMLYINMSWGLGLGIIIDGKLYTGKSGFSGEFGHMSLFDNERLCICGKKGCTQTEISGIALHQEVLDRIRAGEQSILSEQVLRGEKIDLEDIIRAIEGEDILCLEVLETIGRKLGRQLAALINVFNPELLVIGGSLAATGEHLRQPAETVMRTYSLSVVNSDTEIKTAVLGRKAGLIGACMMARSRFFEEI